jgi:hypothetical protein
MLSRRPWAVVLLLSESCAVINDLDVILHGFMLQIIYTTVFRVKRLNHVNLKIYSCLPCLKIVIVVIVEEEAKSEINNNKLKDESIFLY